MESIECIANLVTVKQVFARMSSYLDGSEKHFHKVKLWYYGHSTNYFDYYNLFSDITFDVFEGRGFSEDSIRTWNYEIMKAGARVFGKSAQTLLEFTCLACDLASSTAYSISKFPSLNKLAVGINASEIHFHKDSNIKYLTLSQRINNVITLKKGFQSLKNIKEIKFHNLNVKKFEKGFLESPESGLESTSTSIIFSNMNLTGDSFEYGTFDGNRTLRYSVMLSNSNIDYIPESSFKKVLKLNSSVILFDNQFDDNKIKSYIDCEDCRNYWLIRDYREDQIKFSICKGTNSTGLFHYNNKSFLEAKCN